MSTKDKSLNIVGESHRNRDGRSRQVEIRRCRVGEPVTLRREPDNKHDPDAIAVDSARGVTIGYISRDHTEWIGGKLKKAGVHAIIERINGGDPGKPSLGVLLRVNADGQVPDMPKRRGWLAGLLGR